MKETDENEKKDRSTARTQEKQSLVECFTVRIFFSFQNKAVSNLNLDSRKSANKLTINLVLPPVEREALTTSLFFYYYYLLVMLFFISAFTMTLNNNDHILSSSTKINSTHFYSQYKGHPVSNLKQLIQFQPNTPTIYLAGDSTLDNKYWLPNQSSTHPDLSHATLLDTNILRYDISYWLNKTFSTSGLRVINCAVEESALDDRSQTLLEHDKLIRDNIHEKDILVVSVGGNDVAIKLKPGIIFDVICSVYLDTRLGRWLKHLFRDDLKRYINQMIEKTKPKLIVICSLYFPDETQTTSWAGTVLSLLGYNSRPERMQTAMKKVYEEGIKEIQLEEDLNVIYVPFYEVLNGKDTSMYVARVEPSEKGGKMMAEFLKERILEALNKLKEERNENDMQ